MDGRSSARLETGFQPILAEFGQRARSQAQNNGKAQLLQGANANSGRDGQWDNSQGFIGFSNPTYGTLVGGRVNTLGLDGLIAYDVMSSAYAFSPFGYSGSYAGFGDTELTRSNTAIKSTGTPNLRRISTSRASRRSAATTRATLRPRCGRAKSAQTSPISSPACLAGTLG